MVWGVLRGNHFDADLFLAIVSHQIDSVSTVSVASKYLVLSDIPKIGLQITSGFDTDSVADEGGNVSSKR